MYRSAVCSLTPFFLDCGAINLIVKVCTKVCEQTKRLLRQFEQSNETAPQFFFPARDMDKCFKRRGCPQRPPQFPGRLNNMISSSGIESSAASSSSSTTISSVHRCVLSSPLIHPCQYSLSLLACSLTMLLLLLHCSAAVCQYSSCCSSMVLQRTYTTLGEREQQLLLV